MITVDNVTEKLSNIFDMQEGDVAYLVDRKCGIVCIRRDCITLGGTWLVLENAEKIKLYTGTGATESDIYKIRDLREGESFTATFS
jgi:hypothetical protein